MAFDAKDLTALLRQLSETHAPSGHEAPVRAVIQTAWTGLVDSFETDGLGSLIALKQGAGDPPRRRVMLCAHMDEIGLIVSHIRDGFLRTAMLGGIDYRVLLGQPVLVHGRQTLRGVFGAAPPHMARSRSKYPAAEDLWIDVGLPAEEVAALVRVGDAITFDTPFTELKSSRVLGKSLDNRASVAALTLCLHELQRLRHTWDVYAVASAQEEMGGYGAATSAEWVAPDIAIAIDATFGTQHGVDENEGFDLGDGPTIGVGPNFLPRLVEQSRRVADWLEIKTQSELLPGDSGTDAWVIQISREGVPSLLFSIPIRNMHSPVEVVDMRDIERCGRLVAAFVADLAPDFLDDIRWPLPGQKNAGESEA